MKIMFMGTPDFAVGSLKALYNAGHEICAVITTPDKPRGRGHSVTQTQVASAADEMAIDVYKPLNLKKENFEEYLISKNPDIIIVVAYGKLLPEYVINYPGYGCVNVHASLLPEYRGAAPIQRSVIDGKKVTGVTTMMMDKGLDTGDMLLKSEVEITDDENFETLHDKLMIAGAELIVRTVDALYNKTVIPQKQDDSKSTYAHMITKETTLIDWSAQASDIHNLIRGLYPVPKAYTLYNGKRLKICKSELCNKSTEAKSGTILESDKKSFYVSCGNNSVLKITDIQAEGKKQMSVEDYFKGNSIDVNVVLGV